ncbi:hypothetical protein CONPUDRAFT_78618 [Coniophora puteana RWD-64-598 SS2]|uniref:Transmembrane protein n=1 Tax=Coniophora puteana (strain RWD-64-598) TaxID=741705 RepID=A0A5M3N4B2_CONPW|nr:uncharacterized protein CONPUDRAFT_78618 [Coniophora puteana RWD-64-598 SS2]EIW86136.1 hypothetical protein CONPUDRAFT_78618 [Coniophora puteana RWD-64-598 SS2]
MVPPPHLKREIPEIDGSPAGFIALVVVLSVIILASCIAVFFLLRDHEPSDAQRAARRSRYMREIEREASTADGGPGSTAPPSLTERMKRIWRTKGYASASRRGSGGWVQATGDEWETSSANGDDHDTGMRVVGGTKLKVDIPRAYADPYARSDYPASSENGHSQSQAHGAGGPPVRIVDSPVTSEAFDPFRIPSEYLDPFHDAQTKQPPPSVSHGHYDVEDPMAERRISIRTVTAERALSPIRTRGDDIEAMSPVEVRNPKHFSTQSGASVRTFEGGTKFLEGL